MHLLSWCGGSLCHHCLVLPMLLRLPTRVLLCQLLLPPGALLLLRVLQCLQLLSTFGLLLC